FGGQISAELRPLEAARPLRAECCVKMCNEVPPGLADGLSTTRHGYGLQSGQPMELRVVGEQELAAPNLSVGSKTEPVKNDTEHRRWIARHPVPRHACGDMRMMMLHLDEAE